MQINTKQAEIYQSLETSFKTNDHWHFDTSRFEQDRFRILLSFCQKVPHVTVLEIGCAEGHFTQQLTEISKSITAIDVSKTAIQRAKKRAPNVTYSVSSLEEMAIPEKKFDLIVCSETLYYLKNQQAGIQHLKKLGNYLVTSSFLMNNWRGYTSEYHLSKLKLLQRNILFSLKERKLTVLSLWRLS